MIASRRQLAALVALTLVWGVNWPMMKFSLRELSPLYFRALTMSGGALLLLAWYASRGIAMKLPRATWAPVAMLALPNIFGWLLFSILGVQELASQRLRVFERDRAAPQNVPNLVQCSTLCGTYGPADLPSWQGANRSDASWHLEDLQRRHGGKGAAP